MTKAQKIQELENLKVQQQRIQAEIEALEVEVQKKESLLFVPEMGEKYFQLSNWLCGNFTIFNNHVSTDGGPDKNNTFQSKDIAEQYKEAIGTLIALRHQDGTVPAKNGPKQFVLRFADRTSCDKLAVEVYENRGYKMEYLSPCFESKEAALAAMESVGEDRIVRMHKILHHAL